MESEKLLVKENVSRASPLSLVWLLCACAAAGASLVAATLLDRALPAPLTRAAAPPHRFIAEIAHEHLVNLTKIGPRVAGSYENEVVGVGVVVTAVRQIARRASPHVRVELDVQTASGTFPLAFLDGMNHIYQDVSNVVVRLSGAGGGGGGGGRLGAGGGERRSALLLNCHIDTVPDSPGASDDGAGCAVLLETLRALATARAPPRHAAIFLFNAAEENILQASHGFITQHKWAKQVRAFINIEACGAGGREVMFQAGPHDPWIVETYAGAVPHPFASSLAQELFESGLIPADTDFRIFRDFGNLSGVDLAWSSNGYVYHTALDTAERVSPAVLQRTGDNVLALARGMLSGERLSSDVEMSSRQPVYFDVVGAVVVSARAPAALLGAALALAALVLDVHLASKQAARELWISRGAWWLACVWGACVCACACLSGVVSAGAVALLLHAAGARLAFYSRPLLLAPLYAAPALCVAWCVCVSLSGRWVCAGGARGAGWWRGRALQQGGALLAAAALFLAAARGLRSGFLPALWTFMPALAGLLSSWSGCWRSKRGGRQAGALAAWWWGAGALLPSLQTWYLALGSLRMFVPVAGRAGSTPLPPDVLLGVVCAALSLGACWWLVPVVCVSRGARLVAGALGAACLCACALVCSEPPHAAYSPLAPQRLMVFHTRRTEHAGGGPPTVDHVYWVPEMDVNTRRTLHSTDGALRAARPVEGSRCVRWPYCGLPYYFPALRLVRASLAAPAPPLPPHSPARLQATLTTENVNHTHAYIHIHIQQGPAHVVVSVSPRGGVCVVGPLPSAAPPPAPDRKLYFYSLHSARRPHAPLALHLARCGGAGGGDLTRGALVSLAGHALFSARAPHHERLLRALPPWTAPTGWTVDLHLHAL